MGDILTGTPPELTYLHPIVKLAWMTVWAITSGALVVILGWMGLSFIVQEHLGRHQSGWREMVPRLVLGLTAAASSLWWCALVIDVAHAVSGFIAVSLNVTPGDLLRAPLFALLAAVETANTGLAVFIALLYLVFGFFVLYLLVQMILRLALIDILLALAPIALGLWILPHTANWGRHWLRMFMTTVFQQAVQLIALAMEFAFLGEFAAIAEGEPSQDLVWKLLMAIAFMYLAGRVPSMLGNHGTFDAWLHTLYFGMSLPGGDGAVRPVHRADGRRGRRRPAGDSGGDGRRRRNQHRRQRGQLGGPERHAPEPGAIANAKTTGADSLRVRPRTEEVPRCASSERGQTRKRITNQINFKEKNPMENLTQTISNLVGILLGLVGVVGVGYFIYGAYLYLTASGAPNQMERGKSAMMTALAGIVLALVAYGVVELVMNAVVGNPVDPSVPDPTNSGGGSGTTGTGDGG